MSFYGMRIGYVGGEDKAYSVIETMIEQLSEFQKIVVLT